MWQERLVLQSQLRGLLRILRPAAADEEIVRHNQEHKRQMAMAAAAAGVKPAEPVSDLKYTLGLIGSSTLTLYANRIQTHIGKTSETIPLSAVLPLR